MSFWQPNTLSDVNIGTTPNDGTGDDIRTAFDKVDKNFSNVSQFLSSTTYSFLNANISQTLNTNYLNASNVFIANTTGTTASITSNITAGNLISNTGLYSSGTSNFTGNTYATNLDVSGTLAVKANVRVSAAIVPSANLTYDLGDSTHWFNNLYVKGIQQVNTVSASSDAGLLTLHANLSTSDVKDVGVFGKYYNGSSNNYAFFGHQQSTHNFVYKITPTDWTLTTSVISDGVYGNVQFGSAFLSNATAGGNTLIVTGNTNVTSNVYAVTHYGNVIATVANITRMNVSGNVSGNLYVDGTVYSANYPVVTLGTTGIGPLYSGGSISGLTSFISATPSTSTITGAVTIPYGGLGVGGNIYAGGFVGPLYGLLQTAAQPNITSLGTLTGLTVSGAGTVSTGTLQATQVNATNMLATGSATFQSTVSGISTLTAGTVNAATIGNIGSTLTGTLQTAAQTNITSVGTLTSLAVGAVTSSGTIIASTMQAGTIGNVASAHIGATGRFDTSVTTGTLLAGTVGNVASAHIGATGRFDTSVTTATLNAATIGNTGATLTGTLSTAAQTNITSVGTLTSLAVNSGGITSVGTIVTGTLNAATIGNVSSAIIGATGRFDTSVTTATLNAATIGNTGATLTGTLSTAAQTNITSVGTLSGLTVTAPITGNIAGSAATLTTTRYINSVAFNGSADINISAPSFAGNLSGSTLASGVTASSLTSVGTLTGLTVSGAIVPNGNLTVNLGGATAWWATIYGKAVQAQYADLAENYQADSAYPAGTVLIFGGDNEVTTTNERANSAVAGVVSTNPAYLMNGGLLGDTVVPIALRGRVPCFVQGQVVKGDLLVTSSVPGVACSVGNSKEFGVAIFAKALENKTTDDVGTIEVVIL
ncbi:hypothetical protein UFOVP112_406 [uncultured Caudovirales phage]|uniref:Uncharacterized protein n=1 Tax=uncultured Caudovirales phage TaxID=2100421 RepID=A0A6J5L3N2_9CAUD|nr:hypothetical protein UFOVP112_406 [uncultured Caudovirales phage]